MEATQQNPLTQEPEIEETPQTRPRPQSQGDFDQQPTAIEEPPEKPQEVAGETRDVVNTFRPKAEVKKWKFGSEGVEREYIQRPLSFMGKMQWMSLVGEVLDKAMSGENALTIGNLFSVPNTSAGNLSIDDFRDADVFIQAIGKLVYHAPKFLEQSFCIWLNVPDYEWDLAIALMQRPKEEGGLSDNDGIEMIERFIDQNWAALDSFFRDKAVKLRGRVQKRIQETQDTQSQQSKR